MGDKTPAAALDCWRVNQQFMGIQLQKWTIFGDTFMKI
jgi:hypothetical protein